AGVTMRFADASCSPWVRSAVFSMKRAPGSGSDDASSCAVFVFEVSFERLNIGLPPFSVWNGAKLPPQHGSLASILWRKSEGPESAFAARCFQKAERLHSEWRGQVTRWSLTMPTACANA